MAYTCTVFSNTGFNPTNIPDTPDLLNSYNGITLPALTISQQRFLSSVNVSATWDQIKDADYCKVGDFYYFVNGISMVAPDTAQFSLVADFITSAGGATSLTFLDGITERHHIAKNDDIFGKYCEDDALTNCMQPLQVVNTGWHGGSSKTTKVFVESTLRLPAMLTENSGKYGKATNWVSDADDASNLRYVTVPDPPTATGSTIFSMAGEEGSSVTNGTRLYMFEPTDTASDVQKGMQTARNLGVESAIISQYTIPDELYSISDSGEYAIGTITGKNGTIDTELPFEYTNVRNKRCLYGSNNKYGIISATGSKSEMNPEMIYSGVSPSVDYRSDPRPDGCPYYSFANYRGGNNFWINAIKGETWRHVPLIYTERSGNYQAKEVFDSNMHIQSEQFNNQQLNRAVSDYTGFFSSIANGVLSLFGKGGAGNTANDYTNAAMNGITGIGNFALSTANGENANNIYDLTRRNEMMQFGFSQYTVAPQVTLSASAGALRDYVGNGIYVYRYRPSDIDIKRIDKLLTMYGYKDTAPLTKDMLTNRPEFNYVQAQGVSIGGTLPQWWKSGIAQQFSAGVRVWHEKPNIEAYTKNE